MDYVLSVVVVVANALMLIHVLLVVDHHTWDLMEVVMQHALIHTMVQMDDA